MWISVCTLRIYHCSSRPLKISVAVPFKGLKIIDVFDRELKEREVLSSSNLHRYRIISHGIDFPILKISYTSMKFKEASEVIHLKSKIRNGTTPLSDYKDLIDRMFNMYGANSFDRSSAVLLKLPEKEVLIRRFVLDTVLENDSLHVLSGISNNSVDFEYEGSLYAMSMDEPMSSQSIQPVELLEDGIQPSIYHFPNKFENKQVIVFSGRESEYRIIPKYFNRTTNYLSQDERESHAIELDTKWTERLLNEELTGMAWRVVCSAFEICVEHELPFSTFSGLKVLARSPKLLVKFVLEMFIEGKQETLLSEVEKFEEEIGALIHLTPPHEWIHFIKYVPPGQFQKLSAFLCELLASSLTKESAEEILKYVMSGKISPGKPFHPYDIRKFGEKIHGLSESNSDLPTFVEFSVVGDYYSFTKEHASHRMLLSAAMCAAENACKVEGAANLFSPDYKNHVRVANFYRKYFKEIYSSVFLRTFKLIIFQRDKR